MLHPTTSPLSLLPRSFPHAALRTFTTSPGPSSPAFALRCNGLSPRRLNDYHLARPPLFCAPVAASCHHELVLRPPQVGRCECPRTLQSTQWHVLTPLQAPASPATGHPVAKKDPNAPEPTPLEKLLVNAGPLRGDGSDKFFGFENVSAPAQLDRWDDAC